MDAHGREVVRAADEVANIAFGLFFQRFRAPRPVSGEQAYAPQGPIPVRFGQEGIHQQHRIMRIV